MATIKTDNVQSPSLSSPSVTVDPTTGIVTYPSGLSAGFATQAAANSTLTLVAASATIQEFTGTTAGQIVQQPVTSTLLKGWKSIISNKSTQPITVNSSGGNLIATVPAGTDMTFACSAVTGTTAASWSSSVTGASNASGILSLNAQSGTTYTPVLADVTAVVTLNNAAAITVTIPPNSSVAYPLFTILTFRQVGAGQVAFAQGAGVTITSNGATSAAPKLRVAESWCQAFQSAANVWQIFGDIV